MARKVLPQEKIDQVISLRQKGDSWLKIQKGAGVPRRAAKRLYEEWEQSKSLEDLKAARRDVAAEELRKHLDTLVDFAEFLVGSLDVPKSPNENRPAEKVFDELLRTHILQPHEPHRSRKTVVLAERRVSRQNRLLLKALQDHTEKKVDWKILVDWMKRWDECIAILANLKREANKLIVNYLKLKPGLEEKLLTGTGKKDAVERVSKAVLNAAWWGAITGSLDKKYAPFVVPPNEKSKIVFGQNLQNIGLSFADQKLRDDIAKVCTQAAESLFVGETLRQLCFTTKTIGAKIAELEEMLDPLVLRPLILRNRCGLCPV